MDDMISRQAAIDAAIEATDSWEGVCSIGRQKCIENYINSLPFAPGMDLISRRAAIDICANVIDLFRGWFGAGVLVAIKESIEELPSAQLATDKNVGTKLSTNLAEVGTDCISRAKAIDALTEYGNGRAVFISVGEAVIRIEQLPTAQPEIIRCKECKHRDPEDKKCDCGHGIEWQLPRQDDWFCADGERREVTT